MVYKYRDIVEVPPLEMVDDVVTASKFGENSVTLNSEVNYFIEHKKLKLSEEKCANIHIGNKESRDMCPYKIFDKAIMKESDKEKNLGEYLTTQANSKETIESRKSRGYAILSEISALMKDVPMGNRRTHIGLELWKAWFQNGCLFNSEVWSGMTENNLNDLEVIDCKILWVITGAQAKVPIEMLYLETAQLPIIHVITVRRLMYWHTILNRNKEQLISKIYFAMKNNPLKDDWIHHVMKDLEKIGFSIEDEENLSNLDKISFKALKKKNIKQVINFTI